MDERLYRFHAELEDTHWWLVAKNRILASLIDRFAPAPALSPPDSSRPRLLDVGCGAGGLMSLLSDRFDCIGVDTSPLARDAARARGLVTLDGALPDRLPHQLVSQHFDIIVMSEVLEHVERDRASAEAAVRLLAPRGLLVCTVPAHPWMWSDHDILNHHVRRYTRRAFAALFAGLPLEQLVLSPANTAAFPLIAASRLTRRHRSGNPAANSTPDLGLPPAPINAALRAAFSAERYWLPHARLPFGVSLVSIHRRTPDPGSAPPLPPPPHTTRPNRPSHPPPPLASGKDPA